MKQATLIRDKKGYWQALYTINGKIVDWGAKDEKWIAKLELGNLIKRHGKPKTSNVEDNLLNKNYRV